MKKIFSLFAAMLLTISAWGATWSFDSYVKSDFTITDYSITMGEETFYAYEVKFTQYAQEWSTDSGTGKPGSGSGDVVLNIYPETASIIGTFTTTGGTLDGSVKKGARVCQDGSSITITSNGEYSYTISGELYTQSSTNINYNYYFDATDPRNTVTLDPFIDEPAKGEDITFTGNSLYAKDFNDNNLYLDITDVQYNDLYLQIVATEDTLEAGTYTVGTEIVASTGMDGFYAIPSYFTYGWDTYFIVGGSLEISYSGDLKNLLMAGTLVTGHGTNIIVNNTLDNPWYVAPSPATGFNEAVAPNKAVKELINGQLYIRKEGKLYNVLGF